MNDWAGAALLVLGVLALGGAFGLVRRSLRVFSTAEQSLMVIGDRALDDDGKARALQRLAGRLFGEFALLLLIGGAAFGLPLGALWAADQAGWASWDGVLAASLDPRFLGATLGLTVIGVAVYRRQRRRGRPAAAPGGGFENRYSPVDRLLHLVAFASTPVQVGLSRVEDRRHRRRLKPVEAGPPVFITALPRAGTTLLLNLCTASDEFTTHTYRRMPFLFTPLWWEAYSRRFRVRDEARERAHGDGLLVSADSPEALEEMLWLAFWEEHYDRDRIHPWDPGEVHDEFVRFFRQHMRKLAALALPAGASGVRRYLSKNNANTARVGWLLAHFPEGRVVIPFRPPLQHAQSLLRQHRNFLAIHARDPFARHYMAGVGHFDFGANLRPIDFGGWVERRRGLNPDRLEYWLRYWSAAYSSLATLAGERVCFVDFDALSHHPQRELRRVADFLAVTDPNRLLAGAETVRVPRPHATDMTSVPQAALDEASAVHAKLLNLSRRGVAGPAAALPEEPMRSKHAAMPSAPAR